MAMFVGYFDDSGSHKESGVIVIGGFVATSRSWLQFDDQWNTVLEEFGIDMFRMSKWSNRAPPFKNWPESKRRECLNNLIEIIADRDIESVGVVLPVESYRKVLSPPAQKFVKPYGFAAQFLIGEIATGMRDNSPSGSKIAYIFESGTPGVADIQQTFDLLLRRPDEKRTFYLSTLTFADKRDTPPLQAADIIAYELYREGQRPPTSAKRYPLRVLETRIPHNWFMPNDDYLKRVAASTEILARAGWRELRRAQV